MALIVKRFLVNKVVSAPYVERYEKLESEFAGSIASLAPGKDGVTIENYATKNMEIIHAHNERVQSLCREFVVRSGISETLSGSETEKPTFDNFFTWDIICSIHSRRMFIEACSSTLDMFPIKKDFSFLTEIDENRYRMLSGQKDI